MYQAIAYGQHDTYRPAVIGLVHPVVVGEGQETPSPHRVMGFSEDVWLLFVDVGTFARDNLERFRQDILEPLAGTLRAAAA